MKLLELPSKKLITDQRFVFKPGIEIRFISVKEVAYSYHMATSADVVLSIAKSRKK